MQHIINTGVHTHHAVKGITTSLMSASRCHQVVHIKQSQNVRHHDTRVLAINSCRLTTEHLQRISIARMPKAEAQQGCKFCAFYIGATDSIVIAVK